MRIFKDKNTSGCKWLQIDLFILVFMLLQVYARFVAAGVAHLIISEIRLFEFQLKNKMSNKKLFKKYEKKAKIL